MAIKVTKVLLFSTQWPEYMIELANALSKHCTTGLLLPSNHRLTETHRRLISKDVSFFTFEVVFHKSIRDNFRMALAVRKVICFFDPEIIHIQANGHKWFPLIYLSLLRKPKIVNTIHDPYLHPGDMLSLKTKERWSKIGGKLYTSRYVVHGEFLKKELVRSYGLKSADDRIDVIPHGNFSIYKSFQKRQVKQEEDLILFFGRIWKYKGLDYFIKAANILTKKGSRYKYVIAGIGENLQPYQELIDDPGSFEIHNYRIPLEDAGIFFQRACIIVLPYIDASQSGVIPVAFAYARPVVVTEVGSLSEVVDDSVEGYIVPPCDEIKLAEAIEKLMKDPGLRKTMGENAQKKAGTYLSWNRIASLTMETYIKS